MPKKKPKTVMGRPRILDPKAIRIQAIIDPPLADAIDRAAKAEGKTRSEIIRARLAAAFNVEE